MKPFDTLQSEELSFHIAFDFVSGPWGGGNQFLKALREQFRLFGVYSENLDDATCVLVNSFHLDMSKTQRAVILNKLKSKERPYVIHRLDGPFHAVRGKKSDISDLAVTQLNSLIADGTVFQTDWVRERLSHIARRGDISSRVIGNSVDSSIFFPNRGKNITNGKVELVYSSWSQAENKGFDTLAWLDKNLDWSKFSMTFVGNCPRSFENIRVIQPLGSYELATELRRADIYVCPAMNEPSSNALLEALNCGLPAVALKHGGNPELVSKGGELYESRGELLEKIELVASRLSIYKSKIRVASISDIALQYMEFGADLGLQNPRKSNKFGAALFILFWLSGPAKTLVKLRGGLAKAWFSVFPRSFSTPQIGRQS